MTSRQRSDLVVFLACYAVACLAWEAFALSQSAVLIAMGETMALRSYRMPWSDSLMGYGTQVPMRAGMTAAAAVAAGLACLAAFATRSGNRLVQSAMAVAVGAYALADVPASVPVLGLGQMAMGGGPLIPLDMAIPSSTGFDVNLMHARHVLTDIDDAMEAALALGVLLARAGAVVAAVALLWPARKRREAVTRHAVPAVDIQGAAMPGGVRTPGG